MNNFIEVYHNSAVNLTLAMYVGSKCKFCNHTFDSVEDIKKREVVCAENSGDGLKFACKECFAKQSKGVEK